ncbi:formyltetrahydrofolate deformylase [Mucilaginibacter sp. CAU 1740]|uniref:formyltetrahydrofolate deformylase n=1 Tax=Mucilaginibacter sp. CAU 1740 TaxID=3140365 RepID=UPI00325A6B6A
MIIVIQCQDKVGLVAAIASTLAKHLLNIVSMREHVDHNENVFFTRLDVEDGDTTGVEESLRKILPDGAYIAVNPEPVKKVVVLATKEYHCLSDILIRNHFGTLGASVQCVIANHDKLKDICARFDIPFYYISHEGLDKADFEEQVIGAIKQYPHDYVVLAKYMRILSPRFVAEFPKKIINIHHSFLPAFIGANPYKQAFERGVKLIGATAHYVSDELDEGPIIAQQIVPVNHSYSWKDMVKAGQEVETSVLAKALKLVFEDRVFVHKNKTVVFG